MNKLSLLIVLNGGAGGAIMPAWPSRDDLFLIVSIDGANGAFGLVVNKVNYSLRSFSVGGAGGGETVSDLIIRDDRLLIDVKVGKKGADGI